MRDFWSEVGLNEPFTAFHNGSETEVSLDEVKLVRFGVIDNICERSYSCDIPVKCVYEGIEFHLGNSGSNTWHISLTCSHFRDSHSLKRGSWHCAWRLSILLRAMCRSAIIACRPSLSSIWSHSTAHWLMSVVRCGIVSDTALCARSTGFTYPQGMKEDELCCDKMY